MSQIIVENLRKTFSVAQRQAGPNDAGKSTTVKTLSGILVSDEGRVTVLGNCPWIQRYETVARLGVFFGQRTQLWWDLPVMESFDLLRDIYNVTACDTTGLLEADL